MFAARAPVGGGAVKQPRNLGADGIKGAPGVGGGQHVRQQLLPVRPRRRIIPCVRGYGSVQGPDDSRGLLTGALDEDDGVIGGEDAFVA